MLPVTESLSERLLRLPMFFGLSEADQLRVIQEIRSFFGL
jgi:dTDP-4-amino-4,6-dideoxygalactose transaminase